MVVQRFTEPRSQRDPGSNKIVRNQNNNNQWYLVVNVPYPNNTDVLCGRGGGTNNHPGNLIYRQFVEDEQLNYTQSPKSDKILYSNNVVQRIRNQDPPGRFLQKNNSNTYDDIGDQKAREKTSQCLREGQPSLKRELGADNKLRKLQVREECECREAEE